MKNTLLPELLAPAGSPSALEAAIEGGADAVYVGGLAFNARINAKNFTPDELRVSIARAHSFGVKVYIAANTLIHNRELDEYLHAAEQAYLFGADAMIVADLGAASEIKKRIGIDLHASTQLSGHNVAAAKILRDAGFSRMVCAREMSREDLYYFCNNSPIESEVFVHGALCVCHSGQCLFSSVVGGRSGNRGECAQPCRLPYKNGERGDFYPLSLKDLSLASHVRELCDMGVSSLKIEGRMKSPEYVRDVTRIWRQLLDGGRDATLDDMQKLAKIFSRGGFTDGYFTGRIDSTMLGVRSDADKKESTALLPFKGLEKKLPLELYAEFKRGKPAKLRAVSGERESVVFSDVLQEAINAPMTRESAAKNLSKVGGTDYRLLRMDIDLDDGLIMPVSALNALRRNAIERLQPENIRSEFDFRTPTATTVRGNRPRGKLFRSALFYDPSSIPTGAEEFFDRIYIPLEYYEKCSPDGYGVMLPEVIYDSGYNDIVRMLDDAFKNGARYALVGNIGHLELVKKAGFTPCGDMRLNIYNNSTVSELEKLGFEEMTASPELGLAQQRDLRGKIWSVVYGRLPLMITEKCVGKELGGCRTCKTSQNRLVDRRGVSFPVIRRYVHRSVIFNSVPIYMGDRGEDLLLNGITMQHFVFSIESRSEAEKVIDMYKEGKKPTDGAYRRLKQ